MPHLKKLGKKAKLAGLEEGCPTVAVASGRGRLSCPWIYFWCFHLSESKVKLQGEGGPSFTSIKIVR